MSPPFHQLPRLHAELSREITSVMTTPLSLSLIPDQNPERVRTPSLGKTQDLFREKCPEQFDRHSLGATVQISPTNSIKRHSAARYGMITESIYAPAGSRIEFRFDAPVHLLAMYDEGARRKGETSIDGLPPSTLRSFADKQTFVPAGCAYHEWHEISTATRITFIYLDPVRLHISGNAEALYVPRIFFDDPALWRSAGKIRSTIERGQGGRSYLEALVAVLAHELPRSDRDLGQTSPVNRGGLTSWQMRAVTEYIEGHVGEQISLVTLAQLARLGQYHFCRAFKRSLGIPPHQYHLQRRIARAKVMLADQANSVTDVALILGYSQTSAFSIAFRKITGRTPTEFRRDFV